MEYYFTDLYRTRLFAPLVLLFLLYVLSARFRGLIRAAADRVNRWGRSKVSFLLFLITLLAGLLMIYPGKSWGGDYSQYYAQARALATGTIPEWYRKNSFIINNSCDGIGSDVYPWMWAIMLVPVWKIFHGFPAIIVKLYEVFLLGAGAWFMIHIFLKRMSPARALFLSLFVSGSYQFLCNVNAADADVPGFFWSMMALYLMDWYLQERNTASAANISSNVSSADGVEKHNIDIGLISLAAASGAGAAAAVLTKTLCEGIILALAAYDLVQLIRRKFHAGRRWWIGFIPYGMYFLCKGLCDLLLMKSGGTYRDYFTFSGGRFRQGLREYFVIFSRYFGSSVRPLISVLLVIITVLFLVLAAAGMVMQWRRELYFVLYVCGMMVMLLFYNYYRYGFTYSFYPLMLLFASYAFHAVRERGGAVLFTGASLTVLALVLAESLCGIYATRLRGYRLDESESTKAREVYQYIDDHLNTNDVVYFFKPRVLYWSTGVDSYFWGLDDVDHLDKADYVLLTRWDDQTKVYSYVSGSSNYQETFDNGEFLLYRKEEP